MPTGHMDICRVRHMIQSRLRIGSSESEILCKRFDHARPRGVAMATPLRSGSNMHYGDLTDACSELSQREDDYSSEPCHHSCVFLIWTAGVGGRTDELTHGRVLLYIYIYIYTSGANVFKKNYI